jgi:hypothetical protein
VHPAQDDLGGGGGGGGGAGGGGAMKYPISPPIKAPPTMPAGIATQLSLLSAANTPPPMPPPIAAPVAAPTSVYSRCSSVNPQADTIPRMATHIRYVPNFLRTLTSLLTRHYSPASGSGLIETRKTKVQSKPN